MKASELRIGNWIKLPSGTETPIKNAMEMGLLEVEPIPLTEEWLLKLGFIERMVISFQPIKVFALKENWITVKFLIEENVYIVDFEFARFRLV